MTYALHHGDMLEVVPALPTGSINLAICDLPYGVTRNPWDCALPLDEVWGALTQSCASDSAIVATATQPFSSALVTQWRQFFRHEWIWHKTNRAGGFLNANKAPLTAHEHVLVFGRKQVKYRPQKTQAKTQYSQKRNSQGNWTSSTYGTCIKPDSQDNGTRYPQSVLPFESEYKTIHPTQKPLALMLYLVLTYTAIGDVVLDPCMGSGVVGIACARLGRRFIGIEKDATYFAAAKARIDAEHARLAQGAA